MRRAALPLFAAAFFAAAGAAWAAADVLAPVTQEAVLAAVQTCADSKPEDVKDFACYKPGGVVGTDTFAQVAVDLQFREIDKRVLQYLETLKQGTTAQPVDFAHSSLACFDPDSAGPFPSACTDAPAGGSPRNFARSYQAACDRSAGLAVAAIGLWNEEYADTGSGVATPSDGDITALLSGEGRAGGYASCVGVAKRKLAAYQRVADLLARHALQSGYDLARQEFVSRISTQYTALLGKLQRMTSKLDLINDKWNQRTKNVYQ